MVNKKEIALPRRFGLRWRWGRAAEQLQRLLERPLVQFTIFGMFLAAVVATMTTGFDVRAQGLDEAMVGQVAPYDVKASHDFSYSQRDLTATQELREKISSSVPPVYDWQEGLGERLRDQVRQAFSDMRRELSQRIIAAEEAPATEDEAARRERSAPEESAKAEALRPSPEEILEAAPTALVVRLARELRSDHFQPFFPAQVRDSEFETLARQRFSPQLENTINALLSEVMSSLIVGDKAVLDRERERGVYLRRLRGDKVLIEYHVAELGARFVPIDATPALLREAAEDRLEDELTPAVRQAILGIVSEVVRPNTTYNAELTLEKRQTARGLSGRPLRERELPQGSGAGGEGAPGDGAPRQGLRDDVGGNHGDGQHARS